MKRGYLCLSKLNNTYNFSPGVFALGDFLYICSPNLNIKQYGNNQEKLKR